jgi:hypothetical protein
MSLKWTIRLSMITPLLLIMAMALAGGGHGWYEPAITLFPVGLVSILFLRTITIPFMILAILQFPFYGIILDKAGNKKRLKMTAFCILVFHFILAVLILKLSGNNWV